MLDYELADRYRLESGRVVLSGVQALSRLPLDQLRQDRLLGHRTSAFLSGYPGSPLGGFDQEVQRALRVVDGFDVVHQPAVNEELGATAVMGSQLAAARPDFTRDGVVGFWYGKAPGLDRAGDALRHGVFAGTSRLGGAVALVGDDPASKSSTMPSSSDATLSDLHMPIFYPGNVAECIELGLHAVAASRASGLWASLKVVTAVADGSGSVDLPVLDAPPIIPTIEIDGDTWTCTPSAQFLGPRMLKVEREFREVRLPLAKRYGVENKLNRITADAPDSWIGLVASGFTYYELIEALRRLGLEGDAIAKAGIRLLHLRMPVPFDEEIVRQFARGLSEIVVIEEKNPTLELLVRNTLYGSADQPLVVGKRDERGSLLFQEWGRLDADAIGPALRTRLTSTLADRLTPEPEKRERVRIPLTVERAPHFCSGCPHNWGVKVPDDALMGSGTGCHGMALLMEPERVGEGIGITAMGNEGTQWIGMAPFVDTPHLFQNYGDGTYFHSGQLAVQNCIGAGVDITFKILYNHTVAMTGGQDAVSIVSVPDLADILIKQGVSRVAITTDDAGKYNRVDLPKNVTVTDRRTIVDVQEELAAIKGVTVLIHDQACAAELRRGRRRDIVETPDRRVVINERICEGCGDCGDVSGCLSLQPIETPFGRKTAIDQNSCNFDYSCLEGDCPAFMSVSTANASNTSGVIAPPASDEPMMTTRSTTRIRMAGIGGTGVVTAAQILGTAATMDGWDVLGLDQTGLSQKAGPVVSDVVITRPGEVSSNFVGSEQADLVLGFDALVAASDRSLSSASTDTVVVASTNETPTGQQVLHPERTEIGQSTGEAVERLNAATDPSANRFVDAAALSKALLGSEAIANTLLLGVATQLGLLPVKVEAIERAIELNGVMVDANLAGFAWGRRWVTHPSETEALAFASPTVAKEAITLPAKLASRVNALRLNDTAGLGDKAVDATMLTADLIDYQDLSYAKRYVARLEQVSAAERSVSPASRELTRTVAANLHKLMAYKDEYEVARLMLLDESTEMAEAVGGPGAEVTWHLHPPMLKAIGRDAKVNFGQATAPAFKALRAGKRVRGTRFDPFGQTEMRRMERALIDEYEDALTRICRSLDADNLADAIEIAALPDQVRGYEDLKVRRAREYRAELARRLANLT